MNLVEYIMYNHTWAILVAIIVILAIIGGYAEKTNFLQGKKNIKQPKEDKNDDLSNLKNVTLQDAIDPNHVNTPQPIPEAANQQQVVMPANGVVIGVPIQQIVPGMAMQPMMGGNMVMQPMQGIAPMQPMSQPVDLTVSNLPQQQEIDLTQMTLDEEPKEEVKEVVEEVTDDEYDKFSEEFDSILPEKSLFEDSGIDDIGEIKVETKSKHKKNDLPSLKNLDLPDIKDLKLDDDDIWKF